MMNAIQRRYASAVARNDVHNAEATAIEQSIIAALNLTDSTGKPLSSLFRVRDNLRQIFGALKRMLFKKKIHVAINGKRCPVLGHVGMLHTVCDVTKLNCQLGDTVTLEINPTMVRGMDIKFE